jgi:putative membrane protein
MQIAISILVTVIALLHLYIMWLEMFAWETRGPKVFRNFPKDLFPKTKTLAANQGLYNGFLAAGLLWTLFITDVLWHSYIQLFFLGCIFVAGFYGAATASKRIFFIQGLPAGIAIVLILKQLESYQ